MFLDALARRALFFGMFVGFFLRGLERREVGREVVSAEEAVVVGRRRLVF